MFNVKVMVSNSRGKDAVIYRRGEFKMDRIPMIDETFVIDWTSHEVIDVETEYYPHDMGGCKYQITIIPK